MTANFLFLGTILYWKLDGYSLSYLLTGMSKVVIAAFLMGIYIYGLNIFLVDWMQKGLFNELGGVLFYILSGAVIYGISLYFLKLKELTMLVDKMWERIK
jgi:hypothetical protein